MEDESLIVDAEQAFQLETEFLSGISANLDDARGKLLRGKIWEQARYDDEDRLRAMMARHGRYRREELQSMPANRRMELRGYEKSFWLWKRPTGAAIATVLAPLEHFAAGREGPAPKVGLGELSEHVRRLTGNAKIKHLVGICSPSGFSDVVHESRLEFPNTTLVLIEPDGKGGWVVRSPDPDVDKRVLNLFDPEGDRHKIERAIRQIEEDSAALLTGSLSVEQVVERTGLTRKLVSKAFEAYAQREPEVRVSRQDGQTLIYRSLSTSSPMARKDKKGLSVLDRLRQLFDRAGSDKDKVQALAERRAALAQRRDRIYDDIGKLEKREAELLEEGRATKSAVPRRRIAAQLAQLRKDIGRLNTTANMLNQQINIIATDIHNLTLIEQGELAELPDTETLTEHAVAAEEMLERLKVDADMVSSLEAGMMEAVTSQEELDILKEFDEPEEAAEKPSSRESTSGTAAEKAAKERAKAAASGEKAPPSPPRIREAHLAVDPEIEAIEKEFDQGPKNSDRSDRSAEAG